MALVGERGEYISCGERGEYIPDYYPRGVVSYLEVHTNIHLINRER